MMKLRAVILFILLAFGPLACQSAGSTPTPEIVEQPSAPTIQPTATPAETAADEVLGEVVLAITGAQEIVFDWSEQRCDHEDVPDLPARAFRDDAGNVQLIATHHISRRKIGPDLNSVVHQCDPIMTSADDPDPSKFNDHQWIAGLYTEDGHTIYTVNHNEYDGFNWPNWYNALTMSISTDSGASYASLGEPPNHLVGTLPYQFEAGSGPYGFMEPSNIIKGADGYYYEFLRVDSYKSDQQSICLMRTPDLADTKAWRAWDGEGFNLPFPDPYQDDIQTPRDHLCEPISPDTLGVMNQSVTYNTYIGRYVMVGLTADFLEGREVWGVYYAFSDDLIHWDQRQLLWEAELPWTHQPGDDDYILYPSLLDPESETRNFETTGKMAYVYFTLHNISTGDQLNRDLVRFPVEFYAKENEALSADVRPQLNLNAERIGDATALIRGSLATPGGGPLVGKSIELSAVPLDGPGAYFEYTLTGTVPDYAQRALVGYRINMECNCSGQSEVSLYEVRYVEGVNAINLVPNPKFAQGLNSWSAWGDVMGVVGASDLGTGQMLSVAAAPSEESGINSAQFAVTPREEFTVTFAARVSPASLGSGYFTIIFNSSNGEGTRINIDLAPAETLLGAVTTDEQGAFALEWEDIPPGNYLFEALFSGDQDFWAVSDEFALQDK